MLQINTNFQTPVTYSGSTNHAWWIDGGIKSSTVGITLKLTNGQYAAVAAMGKFNMYRPTISNFIPENSISVVLDTNRMPSIYLGIGDSSAGGGGMGWDLNVHWKTNFNGTFFYTQLINRNHSWDIHWALDYLTRIPLTDTTGGTNCLDNENPYTAATIFNTSVLNNPSYVAPLHFGDVPSLIDSFYSFADLNDSFIAYLEFQPPCGIPVTIGSVRWGWHGQIVISNGNWSLVTDNVIGPTLDSYDDAFPVWTTVYHNSQN
jgi:hypothetical protein